MFIFTDDQDGVFCHDLLQSPLHTVSMFHGNYLDCNRGSKYVL